MYRAIFNDIQNRLAVVQEVKLVEWYLEQDNQKGGIVNSPCVLVKFEPAVVTQIAKSQEQTDIRFELLIYTDFKKGNAKVGSDTNLHFDVEEKIHTALAGYERTVIAPIERQVGLLKSSMEFICRTTACIPVLDGGTIISSTNISPQVNTSLHIGG